MLIDFFKKLYAMTPQGKEAARQEAQRQIAEAKRQRALYQRKKKAVEAEKEKIPDDSFDWEFGGETIIRLLSNVVTLKYDPLDVTDPFDSYADKKKAYVVKLKNAIETKVVNFTDFDLIQTISIETLFSICATHGTCWWYYENIVEGYQDDMHIEPYLMSFNPAATRVLEELGFRHLNY